MNGFKNMTKTDLRKLKRVIKKVDWAVITFIEASVTNTKRKDAEYWKLLHESNQISKFMSTLLKEMYNLCEEVDENWFLKRKLVI